MSFEENGYIVVKSFIDKNMLHYLQIQSKMVENVYCHIRNKDPITIPYGDSQVPSSFAYYAPLCSETLLVTLQSKIGYIVQKTLLPSYSYMRIYYNGSILEKHTDRPSCEYSATLCIKNNEIPWDICIENRQGNEVNISLEEGDILIYKGNELPHWRNKYEGKEQIQFFLHYVIKNCILNKIQFYVNIMLT